MTVRAFTKMLLSSYDIGHEPTIPIPCNATKPPLNHNSSFPSYLQATLDVVIIAIQLPLIRVLLDHYLPDQ